MRKRIVQVYEPDEPTTSTQWLPLDEIATVEVTSEASSYEIENALGNTALTGWRAALPGEQIIRLIFDKPQALKRICLLFLEYEADRSQEFSLRWSADDSDTFQEIVRQQWNFSPQGSVKEIEDYAVDLLDVKQLELSIQPDRGDAQAYASMARLRLA